MQAIAELIAVDIEDLRAAVAEGRAPQDKSVNWSAVSRHVDVRNETRSHAHKMGHMVVRDVLGWCEIPHAQIFKHKRGPTYRPREEIVNLPDGSTAKCVSRPSIADAKTDLLARIERGEIFTGMRFHSDPRVEQTSDGESRVIRRGAAGILIPVREQLECVLGQLMADGLMRVMPDFFELSSEHVDAWLARLKEPAREESEAVEDARTRAVRVCVWGGGWGWG